MLSIKRVLPKETANSSTLFGPLISTGFNVSASDDVYVIDLCQLRFLDNPLRERDDIVGRFFTGIFGRQQRFVQHRGLLPFFGVQILVARAACQSVFFADSGHRR